MPKRILRALGTLKPWKPKRSLPSYREPTPETSPKLTREQEAELALTRSAFTPGTRLFLISLFLVTIASVPFIQLVAEMRGLHQGGGLPMFDILHVLPSATRIGTVRSLRDAWNLLPRAEKLKSAEKSLETDSVVSQWLLPTVQSWLTGMLRAGNEQVYLGRDGWLFYRPDVDYVIGPPFLDPERLKQRAHAAAVQPEPLKAIVQFRNQLARRGIELIVMAAPAKPSIDGAMLSRRTLQPRFPLQNASFTDFKARLQGVGVRFFDAAPLLTHRSGGAPQYLVSDTHWRPDTMEFVAQQLAAELRRGDMPLVADEQYDRSVAVPKEITGVGDIARMLKLPPNQRLYPPQTITIQQVNAGNEMWRSSADADVLLLGDSFANIFSLEALGWGEAAGFAEHLSLVLGGRPLDCILRNSDGAFATREVLANELARGRDRLAGKKLVIWEFAARELAFGNWKLLELKLGKRAPSHFYAPPAGAEVEVTGTIAAISPAPRPGSVPYKDHIVAAHLVDIETAGRPPAAGLEALVYLPSMKDNVWTPAARLRVGESVTLKLRAWSDVSAQKEQINRSDLDDPALQLEEPVWGEFVR